MLCHSAACIHCDGDRVGDSEPEAEGDGVADADSEAEREHGGECMHVSRGAGEAAAIWKCESYGSGVTGGGGIPEADSDGDGVGAVAQSNHIGSSNSQSFGRGG